MSNKLPPELAEKLRHLAEFHRSASSPEAILICIEDAYPLIVDHVTKRIAETRNGCCSEVGKISRKIIHSDKNAAKRAAEICRKQALEYGDGCVECAEAIEHEFGVTQNAAATRAGPDNKSADGAQEAQTAAVLAPAAAPNTASRSQLRRRASQKGEPAPEFAPAPALHALFYRWEGMISEVAKTREQLGLVLAALRDAQSFVNIEQHQAILEIARKEKP